MGKAQSKRSVDITTEVKKDDVVEEGTGKMEKIDVDVDQMKPQVNGDTQHNEKTPETNNDKDKTGESEGTENEKDLSTEKEAQQSPPSAQPEAGDSAAASATVGAVASPTSDTKSVENGSTDETLNESKATATTDTSVADNSAAESSKKPKKEKVKKKWSIRSLSFGKKDKQKPSKKEEAAAAGVVNGECEKVPEETVEEQQNASPTEENKPGDSAAAAAVTEQNAVQEKSVELQAEAVKAEPILNGTSEHGKEEANEKKSNAAAADASAEKKIEEPISNEKVEITPPTVEVTTKTPEPKVEVKTDGIVVSEVKSEATDITATDPSASTDVAAEVSVEIIDETAAKQQNENVPIIQTNDIEDGEKESAQNLPPPPLPCTPPPSQVMVFALSENKSNDQQETIPATIAASESLELSPPSTEQNVEDVLSVPPPSLQQNVIEVLEPQIVESRADTIVEAQEEKISTHVDNATTEPQSTSDQNKDILADKTEEHISLVIPEKILESVANSELNPEKIAETIALIDEVTQEAAVISQKMLDENSTNDPVLSVPEVSSNDLVPESTPTSVTNSENSNNLETPLETSINSVAQQEPSKDLQEKCSTETENAKKIVEISKLETESISETNTTIESFPENQQKVETDNQKIIEQTEPKSNGNSELQPTYADVLNNSPSQNGSNKADDISPPEPISKTNGVAENHDHAAETSATESLNGHAEERIKTVEELKSEQIEKAVADITSEMITTTVQVTE